MLVVKLGEGHKGESLSVIPGFRRGRNIEKARLDNRQMYYVIIDVIGCSHLFGILEPAELFNSEL